MSFKIEENILHIEYDSAKKIPDYIYEIADEYEGKIKNRLGFNFPMKFALDFSKKKNKKAFDLLGKIDAKYVIVYKKGDVLTKKHEMCHAKYALDLSYQEKVKQLWNSLSTSYKDNVIKMLKKMNYPENTEILIDEFQAYYYTEKKGFFGKDK
jgi:hypothetical protein